MMKRRPWLAAAGILVLGAMAAIFGFLLLRTGSRHLNDTRGVTLGMLPAGLSTHQSGSPYGVNLSLQTDQANLGLSLDRVQDLGMGWIRQRFPWADIEPQRGAYRWDAYDRLVDAAAARGLHIIAVLDTSPAWARISKLDSAPPADLNDYGAFVSAFVSHYRGRVAYIQVWDEPNVAPHWGDYWASPAEYVAMLKIAYARAKAADPSVLVLAGGLAPTVADDQWNLNDVTFLSRMYAKGARGSFDVLAAKPYGFWSGPDDRRVDPGVLNFSRIVLLRDIMVKNGDTSRPVWAVEMGWNALPQGWTGRPSPWGSDEENKQSRRLVDALTRARIEWPWLDVTIIQGLRFPAAGPDDPINGFALLDRDLQPRPVYRDLLSVTRGQLIDGPGFFPADSAAASYSNGWSRTHLNEKPVYTTSQAGSEMSLRFWGTGIALYAVRAPGAARLYVSLDGHIVDRLPRDGEGRSFIDMASDRDLGIQPYTLADDEHDGEHVLRIQSVSWLGGSTTTIGGFEVVRIPPFGKLYILMTLLALGAVLSLAAAAFLMPYLPWAGWDALVDRLPLAAQLAAMAAVLLIYYLAPLPLAILAALFFAALAVARLDLALILTVLTFPFYLYPRHIGGQVFSLPEVLTLLCFVAWLARGAGKREWGFDGALRWPVLFFVAVSLLSLAASNDLRLSLRELRTVVVEPAMFYVLAVAAFGRGQRSLPRSSLLWALVLAGVAACLFAVLGFAFAGRYITAQGVHQILGPYGSPNNLGLLLERVLPLSLALLLLARRGDAACPLDCPASPGALSRGQAGQAGRQARETRRWGGGGTRLAGAAACSLLIAVTLFLTYSVGAWLGALAGLLVFAALRGRRQLAALAFVVAVLAVVLLPLLRVDRVVSHLGLSGDTTTSIRIDLWRSSLAMLRDHPQWGVGLDGFLELYRGVYILPSALREPSLSHPHNLVLEWWLFLGILGVPALLWLLGGFLRVAGQSLRQGAGRQALLAQGAIAGMSAAVAHGMVDRFYFGAPDLAFVFFTLLVIGEIGDKQS